MADQTTGPRAVRMLSFDECEAVGVDGTGRTGGPYVVADLSALHALALELETDGHPECARRLSELLDPSPSRAMTDGILAFNTLDADR